MSSWGKQQDRLVVRAVDVLSGVLSGAAPEPARRVVASRALLAVEEWLFPLHEELVVAENADAAAQGPTDEQWMDDAAVRRWVTETLAEHASSYNELHEVWEDDPDHFEPRGEHPVWVLLEMSPFARRLRLLQEAAARTAVGLGGDVGVGAHQIGHWTAGRSRPGIVSGRRWRGRWVSIRRGCTLRATSSPMCSSTGSRPARARSRPPWRASGWARRSRTGTTAPPSRMPPCTGAAAAGSPG
ncbi:hypothetical protein [Streptomyces bullii]|uniref:Uncharacterized protein n=1 Tax=Streptomyces bullii TaxID=349910 RepID=A0ABW0V1E2_9ACTN